MEASQARMTMKTEFIASVAYLITIYGLSINLHSHLSNSGCHFLRLFLFLIFFGTVAFLFRLIVYVLYLSMHSLSFFPSLSLCISLSILPCLSLSVSVFGLLDTMCLNICVYGFLYFKSQVSSYKILIL